MRHAHLPLALALAVLPVALVLQSRALAPVAAVALVATLPLAWRAGWRPGALPAPAWPALALLGWGAVSALWSPEPARALDTALRLAALVVLGGFAFAALGPPGRWRLGWFAAGGLLAGLVLAGFDDATGNAARAFVRGLPEAPAQLAFGLKNAMAGMALLAPLALAHPAVPRPWRWALAALLVVVALRLPGEAATLAAIAAALVALLAPCGLGVVIGVAAAGFVLAAPLLAGALLAPGLDAGGLPFSAAHRLVIWDFVAARVADSPWIGWGMEASRAIPGGTAAPDAETLARFNLSGEAWGRAQLLPLHPHNAALQIWLELGAVGAVLASWLLVALGRAARTAAGAACLAAGLVVAMLSYGAWQPWWVAGLVLAACCQPASSSESQYR